MSSEYIGIETARKTLGDIVTAVQQGADVVLTRNGRPAARITRYQEDAMFVPAAEEDVVVTELRVGDKILDILDGGDEFFVAGSPVRSGQEVIIPLAEAHGEEPTPYGFAPDRRVTRVLVDSPVVERLPGSQL